MRWEVTLVALGVLFASVPAIAAPGPSTTAFVAHAPINIASNADFTAANGVVSGTGVPGDPYVITGWSVTTTSGVAIRIYNVSANFTIRDNAIDGSTGISITQSATVGLVENNKIIVHATGVFVANADMRISNNSFIGTSGSGGAGTGVQLVNSNSVVEANAFLYVQYAVNAERASPVIRCNDMHDDAIIAGITVRYTTNATIDCNIMTRCNSAIQSVSAIGTIIVNNSIDDCGIAIQITLTKDFVAANNTISASWHDQVRIDTSTGIFSGNVIVDGAVNGVIIYRSPILFANNTISNHINAAVIVDDTSGTIRANVMVRNGIGLTLRDSAVPHIEANVMANNTIGIDIPYESRQAIVNLSANIVNGVNIDGAINASQQVYFYKAANVTIDGQVRDSGFGAGFFGSVTAQGSVVLYEVDSATINATVMSHANFGVQSVNSFNVTVNGSIILSDLIGIEASVNASTAQVPNCSIAVKNTTITIPHDPIATIGIDIHGCVSIIGRTNISLVGTGIKVDGSATIQMFNSTITQTDLAADISGLAGTTNLTGDVIAGNAAGVRFSGATGIVVNSTFQGNAQYGARLQSASNLTLKGNNFTGNGDGLIDAEVCGSQFSCSHVTASANAFVDNLRTGAKVNGGSSWKGDVALGNALGFDLSSSVAMRSVTATGNGLGARVSGTFDISSSNFSANTDTGLDARGGGSIRDTLISHNVNAGARLAPTFIDMLRDNVSFNFDGIVLSTAAAGGVSAPTSLPGLLALTSGAGGPESLDVHLSILMRNAHDAVLAGNAIVNATHDYWGTPTGPPIDIADTIGAFQNGVTPGVRFAPWFVDEPMTTTGPVAGL